MRDARAAQEQIKRLSRRFSIDEKVTFAEGPGGLPVVRLKNHGASAEAALLGSTALSWKPAGKGEVLYLSRKGAFEPGKSIRGGIPLCFPWFSAHPRDPRLPRHGFFRLLEWEVAETSVAPAEGREAVRVGFELSDSEATRAYWPFAFSATCGLTLDEGLEIKVTIVNRDHAPFPISCAFHPYFSCADLPLAELEGLPGLPQGGRFRLSGEVDRPFAGEGPVFINDPVEGRRIAVSGAETTGFQVWNPGSEKGDATPDLSPGDWRRFVCVEPALFAAENRELEPGESAVFGMRLYC